MVDNFSQKNSSSERSPAVFTQLTGNKDLELETMDRLSDLPKHILDDILSRLSEEDFARTSILSKAWNDTWSTCPILRFSLHNHVYGVGEVFSHKYRIVPLETRRNNFTNHVENTLTRFHDQCIAIREFKLDMKYYSNSDESIYHRVDRWISLAVESGTLEVLELILFYGKSYCLPASVLHAKSLIKLKLKYITIDHAFMNIQIQFSSLKELSLTAVTTRDEHAIQDIISSCPLLEYLSLISCSLEGEHELFGLKSLRIHGLSKLKSVVAENIQEINIDAPNLEDLHYCPAQSSVPFKMNLDKCKNLRGLHLSYIGSVIIDYQWLLELFVKVPFLETLEFEYSKLSEKIKASSVHLKVLEITDHYYSKLKEINIDAPNLCSIKYHAFMEIPTFSFLNSSPQLQLDLTISFVCYWDLQKLRQFLESFEHRSILASLSLQINSLANKFNLDILQDVSVPPPSIKLLNLWVNIPILDVGLSQFVTGLLCCCCPTTITVTQDDSSLSESLIEVFCDVLNSGNHDECYCSSRDIKCWWHSLKGVQVISAVEEDYDKITFHLEY